mmetsp:Transcript_50884/g.62326  ORF Transcript_50884/g.62326 Transcript_50884/m.62326 type:complete len:261 (-) Transcript_50884:23-805(-)
MGGKTSRFFKKNTNKVCDNTNNDKSENGGKIAIYNDICYDVVETYLNNKFISIRRELLIYGFVKTQTLDNIPNLVHEIICYYTSFEMIDSVLLNDDEKDAFFDIIYNTFGHNIKLELLYRSSLYNYSSEIFHHKCDGKGPTISIIKAKKNDILFGGYTSIDWTSSGSWKKDENAFLYSIKNKKHIIYNIKSKNSSQVVRHVNQYGPVYSGGHDIWIGKDCNISDLNYCSNYIYNCEDITDQSKSIQYNVHDYEVFKVIQP